MPNDNELVLDKISNASDVLNVLNKELGPPGNDKDVKEPEDDKLEDKKEPKDEDILDLEDDGDKEVLDNDKEEDKLPNEDEDLSFDAVPTRKEVLAKYPNFFKEFKGIEKAIYREQQYAEVYPSIKDAQASRDALRGYQRMEQDLVNGNIGNVFKILAQNTPESFNKIADNLFETLQRTDEKVYNKTVAKVIKGTLHNAFTFAEENGDEQLKIASQLMHKAIFGSTKVSPMASGEGKLDGDKPDLEKQRFQNEQQRFYMDQIQTHINDVGERASNIVKNTIEKNIDPNKSMSDYVKDKAILDTVNEVQRLIGSDARLNSYLDRLWQEAASQGFPASSKEKIRNVVLQKAKSVLNPVMNKVRNNALKGYKTRGREANDSQDDAPISRSNSSRDGKKVVDSPKLDKENVNKTRGMSTLDILNASLK